MERVLLAGTLLGATAVPAFAGITCNLTDQRGNALTYSFTRGGHGYTNEIVVRRNGETISNGGPMWTRTFDRARRTLTLQQGDWSIVYDSDTGHDRAALFHNANVAANGVCDPDYAVDAPVVATAPVQDSTTAPGTTLADSGFGVPLIADNAGLHIAVKLGPMTYSMIVDTGATFGSVSETIAESLIASGLADSGRGMTSVLADGSEHQVRTVVVHSIEIGGRTASNIEFGVESNNNAVMLFGMNALNQFGKFTIDVQNNRLVFG
jgi:hypothetical protein